MKKKLVAGIIIFIVSGVIREIAGALIDWWVLRVIIKVAMTALWCYGLHLTISAYMHPDNPKKEENDSLSE